MSKVKLIELVEGANIVPSSNGFTLVRRSGQDIELDLVTGANLVGGFARRDAALLLANRRGSGNKECIYLAERVLSIAEVLGEHGLLDRSEPTQVVLKRQE